MIERTRSIIGIMLIISVLSGVFLFWGINRYKQTMDQSILDTTTKAQKIFAQIIRNTNLIYDFQINNMGCSHLFLRQVLMPFAASTRTSSGVLVTVARLSPIFTAFPGSTKVIDFVLKERAEG